MFNKEFTIPKDMDIIARELILNTTSMDHEEKQNWFNNWCYLTIEQQSRIKQILQKEKTKLQKIEEQYQQDIKNLHITEKKEKIETRKSISVRIIIVLIINALSIEHINSNELNMVIFIISLLYLITSII